MAGSSVEEAGVGRSLDSVSNGRQSSQASEALAEYRSSEQVENGTPSTSPPYWDSEDVDDGPKPRELFGKYTWKIDKFSQINKRELRSNAFEVGSYKWYILIYPQGCDVCNHLSLFLCVANHDKLLPGWSHFAQFTIAVVNKDPKKSKYSDTLHRFWKKEHDWGWKKFMELSKVVDGFIDADTLIIKAQVQVIRERADRPFRCLDRQYRRELIRVYLTNVEQICRRFMEERRSKLGKLIEDKARWSSFCEFWLGMDPSTKRRMSREKTESILKVAVKQFFIEKEVTSTLVMDSLYSGLKALDGQTPKSKNDKGKLNGAEEISTPVISMDNDMFVLVDDVLLLLERVSVEPLPPKDEKGPQNRTKDGSSGEDFNKDSVERDERRLTELGRRTIETFVLSHIFSKIEVAYQDAVSLKRQEELIREEAESWLAASEHKSKRGISEKQKKSKKKQGKNKQNNRKIKDEGRVDNSSLTVEDNIEPSSPISEREKYLTEVSVVVKAKDSASGDISDVSDSIDCISEALQPESERDASPVSWATDTSELNSPVASYRSRVITPSVMDDSSSTCSTDSVPSVVMSGHSQGENKSQKSVSRGRRQRGKAASEKLELARGTSNGSSESMSGVGNINPSNSGKTAASGSQVISSSLNGNNKILEQHRAKGEGDQPKPNAGVEVVNGRRPSQEKSVPPSVRSPSRETSVPPSPISPSWDKSVTPSPRNPSQEKIVPPSPRNPSWEKCVPPSPISSSREKSVTPSPRNPSQEKSAPPSPISAFKDPISMAPHMSKRKTSTAMDPTYARKQVSESLEQGTKSAAPTSSSETGDLVNRSVLSEPSALRVPATEAVEMTSASQVPATTRKWESSQLPVVSSTLSVPLGPVPRPATPVASMVKSTPLLARSVSAVGRLGLETSSTSPSYLRPSYHNSLMGNHGIGTSSVHPQPQSANSSTSSLHAYSQTPAISSESSERIGLNSIRSSFSFGMRNHDFLGNGTQWTDNYPTTPGRSMPSNRDTLYSDIRSFDNHPSHAGQILPPDRPAQLSEFRNLDVYSPVRYRSQGNLASEFPASTSGYQSVAMMTDEFPHLDIINDLLADDIGMNIGATTSSNFQSVRNGSQHLNRQFSHPGDISMLNGAAPSVSPHRFQRTQSHLGDGYLREYGFFGGDISGSNPRPYSDGRMNGMVPDQWRRGGSDDLSRLSFRGSENDAYSYQMPDYSNLPGGNSGFGVYRRPSGS